MPRIVTDNGAVYAIWLVVTTWIFEYLVELVAIAESIISIIAAMGWHEAYHADCTSGRRGYYSYSYLSCERDYAYNARSAALLISPVIILTVALTFFATRIFQCVRLGQQRLTPKANFVLDTSRFAVWLPITIWIIVAFAKRIISSAVFSIAIIYAPIGLLFYGISMTHACVVYSRWRKGAFNHLIVEKSQFDQRPPQGIPQHFPHPGNGPCPCCGRAPVPDPAARPDLQEHYAPEKQPPQLPAINV